METSVRTTSLGFPAQIPWWFKIMFKVHSWRHIFVHNRFSESKFDLMPKKYDQIPNIAYISKSRAKNVATHWHLVAFVVLGNIKYLCLCVPISCVTWTWYVGNRQHAFMCSSMPQTSNIWQCFVFKTFEFSDFYLVGPTSCTLECSNTGKYTSNRKSLTTQQSVIQIHALLVLCVWTYFYLVTCKEACYYWSYRKLWRCFAYIWSQSCFELAKG